MLLPTGREAGPSREDQICSPDQSQKMPCCLRARFHLLRVNKLWTDRRTDKKCPEGITGVLGRSSQQDRKFKASLDYRSCLQNHHPSMHPSSHSSKRTNQQRKPRERRERMREDSPIYTLLVNTCVYLGGSGWRGRSSPLLFSLRDHDHLAHSQDAHVGSRTLDQ